MADGSNTPEQKITSIADVRVRRPTLDQRIPSFGSTIENFKVTDIQEEEGIYRTFVQDQYGYDVFRISADESGDIRAKIVSDQSGNELSDITQKFLSALDRVTADEVIIEQPGGPQGKILRATTKRGGIVINILQEMGQSTVDMELSSERLKGLLDRPAVFDFFRTVNRDQTRNVPQEMIEEAFGKIFEERRNRLHLVF